MTAAVAATTGSTHSLAWWLATNQRGTTKQGAIRRAAEWSALHGNVPFLVFRIGTRADTNNHQRRWWTMPASVVQDGVERRLLDAHEIFKP